MPRMDGTGPWGAGPMTGWGRGYCNPGRTGYGPYQGWGPGYGRGFGQGRGFGRGRGSGRGMGWGRGYGRGFGWQAAYPAWGGWYGPAYEAPYGRPYPMDPSEEIDMLKAEAEGLRGDLDEVNKRIEELEKEPSE